MRTKWWLVGLSLVFALGLAPPGPQTALALAPYPSEVTVFDIPNDDGTNLGVTWHWFGALEPETKITIDVEVAGDILDQFKLTPSEQQRLDAARSELAQALAPLIPERDAAQQDADAANDVLQLGKANKAPDTPELLRDYMRKQSKLDSLNARIEYFRLVFASRTRARGMTKDLDQKSRFFEFLQASLAQSSWLPSNVHDVDPATLDKIKDHPEIFGQKPEHEDWSFAALDKMLATNPAVIAGTYSDKPDQYASTTPRTLDVELQKNHVYNVRMVIQQPEARPIIAELGGAEARVNYFSVRLLNNFVFAVLFAIVILAAVMIARRNPNLFIRRIQGLEAVDEAIGRATEMGKPVLYLCGLDTIASLSTLAAINVLGRVARRVADYDSDLVVPCRDPVVLTVAQEVVREGYVDRGRPDAYREDKIFFVTDDQFAYTAATCGIMMREKPAANFFMGGYYAESLLLAETGAASGAIQIAGTDSLPQLPFFITTCDYTLIGEELFAASAYLSREPMLLGSLKGQDVGKALIMLLILVQSLLFVAEIILKKMGYDVPLDFLKMMVHAL